MVYILIPNSRCSHCPPVKIWMKNNLSKDTVVTGEVPTEGSPNFLIRVKNYETETATCIVLEVSSNEKLVQKEKKVEEKKEKGRWVWTLLLWWWLLLFLFYSSCWNLMVIVSVFLVLSLLGMAISYNEERLAMKKRSKKSSPL